MARGIALGGSIAIHALAGLVLAGLRVSAPDAVTTSGSTPALEIVQTDHAMLVEIVEPGNRGGGSGGAKTVRTRERVARAQPRREPPNRARDPFADDRRAIDRNQRSVSDALAEQVIRSVEGGVGGGQGAGGGDGRGHGRGIGMGDGAVISEQPRVAPPVAPRASKARPAKLIYPKREGSVEHGKLFVARVTVDTEGFVVGAQLVQTGGPYSGQAGGLIFKFRYLPALDDDGRPMRSTFDQPFLVQP